MKKLMAVAVMVATMGLAGCSKELQELKNAYNAATGAVVSPTAVIVVGNSFDALEATATNYLSLPRCTGTNGPICSNPKAAAAIRKAVRAGRVARNNLEQFMRDHPGQLGNQGLYDALTQAVATLKQVYAQYNVGATQ